MDQPNPSSGPSPLGFVGEPAGAPGSPGTPGWVSPGSSGPFGSEVPPPPPPPPVVATGVLASAGGGESGRLAGSIGAVGGSPGSTPAGGRPDCVGVPGSEPGGVAKSSEEKRARPSFKRAPAAKIPAPTPISTGDAGSGNQPRSSGSRPENQSAVGCVRDKVGIGRHFRQKRTGDALS